jgi:NAD+--asparagine ADP-ribosyltransferase
VDEEEQIKEIKIKDQMTLPVKQGVLTMIVGKLDSNPSTDKFLADMEKTIRLHEKTISVIDYKPFLIFGNIRDNIIFFDEFDEKKY